MSASWFSHDSNARNSKKLIRLRQKHGASGYGVYWMLIERLRDEAGYTSDRDYEMISFDLRVDVEIIRSVVEDFGLFELSEDGRYFHAPGLDERMELKDVRSAAGKKGAANRWNKNTDRMAQNGKSMANGMAKEDFANSIKEKESKEKKEEISKLSFSSPSSSSPSVEVESSEDEEQKEKILEVFFFRNWAAPNKEYERLIAFNNTDTRCWAKMDKTQRHSAVILWKQKPEQAPRFPLDIIAFWKGIYDNLVYRKAPHSVLMHALSDNIRITENGQEATIYCPEDVRDFIEKNMENGFRPLIHEYLFRPRGLNKMSYRLCPP